MEYVDLMVTRLYQSYEDKPILKALIQAISPIGAAADTILSTYVNKLKADKLHNFFEQLGNGDIELTEEIIANTDYLQFDAESMVTFRRNQVVNISGISIFMSRPDFTCRF